MSFCFVVPASQKVFWSWGFLIFSGFPAFPYLFLDRFSLEDLSMEQRFQAWPVTWWWHWTKTSVWPPTPHSSRPCSSGDPIWRRRASQKQRERNINKLQTAVFFWLVLFFLYLFLSILADAFGVLLVYVTFRCFVFSFLVSRGAKWCCRLVFVFLTILLVGFVCCLKNEVGLYLCSNVCFMYILYTLQKYKKWDTV